MESKSELKRLCTLSPMQMAERLAELEATLAQRDKELSSCKSSEKEGWRYSNELEQERKNLQSRLAELESELSALKTERERGKPEAVLIECIAGAISKHITQPVLQREVLSAAEYIAKRYALPPVSTAVPDGWQLVPIEPTAAMLNEITLVDDFTKQAMTIRYKAMLAVSPKKGE